MKRWQQIAIGFGALVLLAAGLRAIDPEMFAKGEAERGAPARVMVNRIGDLHGAMIVADGVSAEAALAAARDFCAGKTHCSVYGWRRREDAATRMPMLDREVQARLFTYDLNRSTGFERALWACDVFPRSKPDECLGG